MSESGVIYSIVAAAAIEHIMHRPVKFPLESALDSRALFG